ncbi:cysteine dioxygenase 1-like [Halichondria panicea]|uniref:cysteine dioxygenase 1-like n=1 Tax=Halichondria panicea TaxID=6063 RepID=UPI00312BB500
MACSTSSVTWQELLDGVRESFSTEQVDVDRLRTLMNSYQSQRSDWEQYALFDPHTYTRNLVDAGNGRYNLIILCWDSGQGSSIHDHADSHCFLKVLSGEVKETMYAWPGSGVSPSHSSTPTMEVTGSESVLIDDVAYINNEIGLHRVENPSHTDQAVTLHLYCPPITTCQSFEARTGRSHSCHVTFYSKEGQKVCSSVK